MVVGQLQLNGWECQAEVTFNVYGERGAIDVLAWHRTQAALLVIEVKTVVPDIGPMLGTLNRKTRMARRIAAEHGWRPATVPRILVFAEGPTTRRHVARHRATFEAALPDRNVAVKRWLRQPIGHISGLWFLAIARHASGIQRQRIRKARVSHADAVRLVQVSPPDDV